MKKEIIGAATLYLADAAEVIAVAPREYAVVSDPPYGIGYKPQRNGRATYAPGDAVIGDDAPFDPAPLLSFRECILWGAQNFASRLKDSNGWIVWDKCGGLEPRAGFQYSHCEMAWTNFLGRVHKVSLMWEGASRGGEGFFHPTQKPIPIMQFCIDRVSPGAIIFDPYMGSGTTGVAAAMMGRQFVGVEIDEKHFNTACDRISKASRQNALFDFESTTEKGSP
jgi:site-specific DNA-methyltransferase (adenine-specific)